MSLDGTVTAVCTMFRAGAVSKRAASEGWEYEGHNAIYKTVSPLTELESACAPVNGSHQLTASSFHNEASHGENANCPMYKEREVRTRKYSMRLSQDSVSGI